LITSPEPDVANLFHRSDLCSIGDWELLFGRTAASKWQRQTRNRVMSFACLNFPAARGVRMPCTRSRRWGARKTPWSRRLREDGSHTVAAYKDGIAHRQGALFGAPDF